MLRFLCHIFKIHYEICPNCQTLRNQLRDERELLLEQLREEREENKRLNDAIIELVKPKAAEVAPPQYVPTEPFNRPTLFSRRREEMERLSREHAKTLETSTNLGKPDVAVKETKEPPKVYGVQQSIEELERELGVENG